MSVICASTTSVALKLLQRGLTTSQGDGLRIGKNMMRAGGFGSPNPSCRRGLYQVVSAKTKEGGEMEQSKGTDMSKTTQDPGGKHLRRRMRRGLGPDAMMMGQGPLGGLPRGLLAHPLFKDVEHAMEQIDELMGTDLVGATAPQSVMEALRMPGMTMDILETGEAFEIKVDLPGLSKTDVNIALTESKQPELFGPLLTISGENKEASTTPEGEEQAGHIWHRAERQMTTEFKRAVRLPPNVNTEDVKAKMDLGVLHVTVGKKEPVKKEEEEHARMIEIE